jgi:NAD(P)-dependent dehydrogenase (short-subunit alcohol dehydrogenase family)
VREVVTAPSLLDRAIYALTIGATSPRCAATSQQSGPRQHESQLYRAECRDDPVRPRAVRRPGAAREAGTLLKRLGKPEDIAGVALMLASRAGAYITGQTIVVDGGTTIAP